MLTNVLVGFSVLVVVFFLVIILGLQIQISTLTRRIDDLIEKIEEKIKD
jgi:hypothetical protein